jgi:putative hemolysin
MNTLIEIFILLVMVMVNGYLAMAEISIVSARKALLDLRAAADEPGYETARDLASAPGRFLSTVQIGITLVGILAGAFGTATIAEALEAKLITMNIAPATAETIGVVVVVLFTTFISLVLGELVPKQIGLSSPERMAAMVARPMKTASRIASPLVNLLSRSTGVVLRLLRVRPNPESAVTEEEIKLLIDQGTEQGVFLPIEDTIVDRVFQLGDQWIGSLITPRTEVVWLDLNAPTQTTIEVIKAHPYAQFPVACENIDSLLGFVRVSDLLDQALENGGIDLQAALQAPLFVPENVPVFFVLERMRQTGFEIAFVVDEFGGISGMVDYHDLFEALVGDLPEGGQQYDPEIVRQDDGSYLISGLIPIVQFNDLFNLGSLPGEEEAKYQTLGGFVLYLFDRIPSTGESVTWDDFVLTVVDMDGLRIDKVLVSHHAANTSGGSLS